jgi:hypothetical protein
LGQQLSSWFSNLGGHIWSTIGPKFGRNVGCD